MADAFVAAGIVCALLAALCSLRAAYLATPVRTDASTKISNLIRLLRDYTWASRGVVEALKPIVHENAPMVENFETHRLNLANAVRRYLDGSERAKQELYDASALDFTNEIMGAASARAWLVLGICFALVSAALQLMAMRIG